MLDPDIERFSTELARSIEGRGSWLTGSESRADWKVHGSLVDALNDDGVQAFLTLPAEAGAPIGPMIHYLRSEFAVSAFGPCTPQDDQDSVMRAGRLAFTWVPDDHPPTTQAEFTELTRLAWQVLHASTSPHLVTTVGKPRRSARIGPAAKAWAVGHPSQRLSDWGVEVQVRR